MSKLDWDKISHKVEKKVFAKLKKDLVDWETDLEMKAMFLRDVAMILCLGDWKEVEKRLWDMDTAAREYVY